MPLIAPRLTIKELHSLLDEVYHEAGLVVMQFHAENFRKAAKLELKWRTPSQNL